MPTAPWTTLADLNSQREYIVVATRFVVTRRRHIPDVLGSTRTMLSTFSGTEGLLGYSFQSSFSYRTLSTLTVWRDRASMSAFVRGQPHVSAVERTTAWMAESRFAIWTAPADELPPTWRTAAERLHSPAA